MTSAAALFALAALAACSGAPDAETPQPQSGAAHDGGNVTTLADSPTDAGVPASCALSIAFGSYAMGIDRGTLERVETLLEADPAVIGVARSPWGREGEVTLCAAVRGEADRDRLFDAIAGLFPRRPLGPLSLTTNDGRKFEANNAT